MVIKPKFISIAELFPRLYAKFPGIIKGSYSAVTAASGVGKTKFAKFLYVNHAYKYCKENKIPLHIIYFALEESKEKFWITLMCDLLMEKYGETITYYQYTGYHPGLTPEIEKHIKDLQPIIDDMKKHITVFDNIFNPTGMKIAVEKVMNNFGEKIEGVIEVDDWGNKNESFDFKYYNDDTHVLVVTDHISLISPEKNRFDDCSTVHLAINKWSEYVVKFICKKYKCCVCDIHQQEMAGDNTENMKLDNLQPSLNKLGDNKIVGRNYMNVFGIFNPARYKLTQKIYNRLNIEEMKGSFREISLIKHRDGEDNIRVPMEFNGKINYFKEMNK